MLRGYDSPCQGSARRLTDDTTYCRFYKRCKVVWEHISCACRVRLTNYAGSFHTVRGVWMVYGTTDDRQLVWFHFVPWTSFANTNSQIAKGAVRNIVIKH